MVCKKEQEGDNSEFETKPVGIIITIISRKNISQIARKTFAAQCFFTDHLNHETAKTANITIYRTALADPRQLWAR